MNTHADTVSKYLFIYNNVEFLKYLPYNSNMKIEINNYFSGKYMYVFKT